MDCHVRNMPLICYRASKLGEIGQIYPKGDSPLEMTHNIKSSQPNLMILVLIYGEENALSSTVKKDNC